jgi:hypothetical protein
MPPPIDRVSHGPVFLETVQFRSAGDPGGGYHARTSLPLPEEATILVIYAADRFPFRRYCRFVRHRGEPFPYTLDAMEFATSPPGLRLGPWPGWRGIPDLPPLTLSVGERTLPLKASFWGDEMTAGVLRAFCTVEQGGQSEIVVGSSPPGLIPSQAFIYRTSALRSRPVPVRQVPRSGDRPLLLPKEELLRLRAERGGPLREHFARLEQATAGWDLPFEVSPTSKAVPGAQRLAGEDRLLVGALLALVEPTDGRIARALEAFRRYRSEAEQPGFPPLAIDTQAGEVLFQLCLGYDWLRTFLPEAERESARSALFRVARICREHLTPGRRDYGQAHYLGCGLGLLAFSLLFQEEDPEAREWLSELRGALDCSLRLLPEDGAYPHGMNLWIYEFGFLTRWIELIRTATGEDLWDRTPGLAQASRFRAATLSGDARHGITFGDPQYLTGGDSWIHFLIARRTRSAVAQWVGERLLDLPHEGVDFRNIPPRRRAYEFLYYDPSVSPLPPPDGPLFFRDTGQVIQRSAETLFTFRAGPPLGRHRYEQGEAGAYGHSDPSNGAFLLFTQGTLLASGPGPVYRRESALHNLITVDGEGELGDTTVWLPDFIPPERLAPTPEFRTDGRRSAISWNGAGAYLPHLGVEWLARSLFVDLERYVIGIDRIRCDRRRRIEWNFHSWEELSLLPTPGGTCFALPRGIRLALLGPVGRQGTPVEMEIGPSRFVPAYPNDGRRDVHLRCAIHSEEGIFVWALLLSGQELPRRADPTVLCADGVKLSYDGRWLAPEGFDED